jgi:hypothetical protein
LKLNYTHQILVYADVVNILGGSVDTSTMKNTEALVVASKEIELEVIQMKLSTWLYLEIRMLEEITS